MERNSHTMISTMFPQKITTMFRKLLTFFFTAPEWRESQPAPRVVESRVAPHPINPLFFTRGRDGIWTMHTDAIRDITDKEFFQLSSMEKELVLMVRERPFLGEKQLVLGSNYRSNDELCREFMDSLH